MKTGNKQTIKSLEDEISHLSKEKESILIPFVISSIPTKIMESFAECPDYFVSSSVVTFYDGKRNLTLRLSRQFPIKEKDEDKHEYDDKCMEILMKSVANLLPEKYRGVYK